MLLRSKDADSAAASAPTSAASPGRPIANVCFKCYGYMAMSQALNLVADMKLALYMKIPPRSMFMAQFLGTVIGCVVNYAVLSFVLSDSSGYLPYLSGEVTDPTGQWDGRKVGIFYSASIIFGAIGPARFFEASYRSLYWGFAVGALAPVPFYLLHRRPAIREWVKRRGANLDRVAMPVFLHGMNEAPQVPCNGRVFFYSRNTSVAAANLSPPSHANRSSSPASQPPTPLKNGLAPATQNGSSATTTSSQPPSMPVPASMPS